jgi:hypothetical protein
VSSINELSFDDDESSRSSNGVATIWLIDFGGGEL